MSAPDQVAGRVAEVEALGHGLGVARFKIDMYSYQFGKPVQFP
jgi:hypothetical protein